LFLIFNFYIMMLLDIVDNLSDDPLNIENENVFDILQSFIK